MSIENWLTLSLAMYGAILSSILGIREIMKEKRSIAIFLEYLPWHHSYSVVITNIGHRPITIMDMYVFIPELGALKRSAFWDDESIYPFPITLTDGQHISIKIQQNLGDSIYKADGNIEIAVFDAEGKTYKKYSKVVHDKKFGSYIVKDRG